MGRFFLPLTLHLLLPNPVLFLSSVPSPLSLQEAGPGRLWSPLGRSTTQHRAGALWNQHVLPEGLAPGTQVQASTA